MKRVRAHVLIEGRVQGVCYRLDARRAALQRNLTGWVKNLRDGRVEAVFEGKDSDVESMLKWCQVGPALARVDKIHVEWAPYSGEFNGMEITFV